MMEISPYVIRYNIPTKYDLAPFGTIIKVMGDNQTYNLFIQLSRDQESMHWERTGVLFEKIFNDKLNDPTFLGEMLSKIS